MTDTRHQTTVDDCWNRIGVFGDKSCPLVERHIHCRNCETYSAAAITLLDRYGDSLSDSGNYGKDEGRQHSAEQSSLLIFRLGDQWLAIASRCLAEVMPVSPVHGLPHRRKRGLLGVINVRGTLVACLSLEELLGLDGATQNHHERRVIPRMLILQSDSGPLVVPVDEIRGIQRIPDHAISPGKGDAGQTISRFTLGVLQWQGYSITLLDEEPLLHHMLGSLA
ncbi:chemotaxis protein CheW [Pseudomonas sp. NCCP-436]|uniref:chemotaxis protein CheW n=1 Tax=Pseudomonas sp. NCCP-436 TaxID=2842481 RepID=UPI001C81F30C|nr:chemotaxis protein CheW [Pseudomonas sp. NCCP-436]GIZ12899.1 chemotaxis protein CheW [Pseudomonas sp. NCCP-436]